MHCCAVFVIRLFVIKLQLFSLNVLCTLSSLSNPWAWFKKKYIKVEMGCRAEFGSLGQQFGALAGTSNFAEETNICRSRIEECVKRNPETNG